MICLDSYSFTTPASRTPYPLLAHLRIFTSSIFNSTYHFRKDLMRSLTALGKLVNGWSVEKFLADSLSEIFSLAFELLNWLNL